MRIARDDPFDKVKSTLGRQVRGPSPARYARATRPCSGYYDPQSSHRASLHSWGLRRSRCRRISTGWDWFTFLNSDLLIAHPQSGANGSVRRSEQTEEARHRASWRIGAAPIPTSQVVSAPRPICAEHVCRGGIPPRGTFRPRLRDEARQADATGRFFLCTRCRAQVLICSLRPRQHLLRARMRSKSPRNAQREAGRRYQSSRRGRRKHAERARARALQKK
jgi:hypothetical protein